jgi:hypothetical protein
MSVFSQVERQIERGFRAWTEKMFGPADSGELLVVHRAILDEVAAKIQPVVRGQRIFPHPNLTVTLVAADADRRALYQAAFGEDGRLENDIRSALKGAGCQVPRGFSVAVATSETGDRAFAIDYHSRPKAAPATGRLIVVKGKAERAEYPLEKARVNLGRMAEIADAQQRVLRRNDVVFLEGGDEANATVSRKHAHIRMEAGVYRICDDGSEFGTRVFREGRTIEVPSGDRRGERLRPGDEIYLGRICLRFEQ